MRELPKRKAPRLKEYDYSAAGYYFVTICSKDKQDIFGKINHKFVGALLACARDNNSVKIKLTKIGQIIDSQWNNIPNQYNNVDVDQFIIMPNHLHGILIINNRAQASSAPTISQIIRSFKSKTTMEYLKYINQNNLNISGKIWQRSFYDHVIRNEKSLEEIREYIVNNPAKWDDDEYNMDAKNTRIAQTKTDPFPTP
ncbi:MAG: transposase [Candidatus Omnitrophota bacterium]